MITEIDKKEKVQEAASKVQNAKALAPKKERAINGKGIEVKSAQLKEGKTKDIGVPVSNPPKLACSDPNCPYHGHLSIRGRIFEGSVISDKMDKGVVVEWDYLMELPKYKRFMRKKSRVPAHNPPCINAHTGNVVRIAECRPLSKTKSFVVIEILKG
ncbi:MAG: 30S ribosomal protein S17 [Nanoarchaeota archaeon]|nr:30S ribosomal protein S17 [Nanoarchaeota archaeon]MBU4452353.1 30S ribosomal protein S17 [Nanoarchaeota archaeon]